MRIEYFESGDYGWGTILKRSIDIENNKDYISHNENEVNYKDSFTDIYDATQHIEVNSTRHFTEIRDRLISDHTKRIAELQNEINILTANTFEEYEENNIKQMRKIY